MRHGAVDCLVPDPGCARWTDRAPPAGQRRPRRRPRGVRESAIAVAPGHLRSDGSTWEGAVRFRRQGRHELLHPLRAPPQLRRRHLHDEGRDTGPDVEAAGQATAGERRARVARSARSAGQGLVDEDAGGDDVQAQPRPTAASMHCVLALFSRHVQLRGRRSGAAARVRRIRDVHARPEAAAASTASSCRSRGTQSESQRYRLQVARAGPDDIGPGVPLANQQTLRGTLNASRINVVNFFHFDVALSSDVTLRLRSRGQFDLVLLSETGRRIDCECSGSGRAYLRRGLQPGQYFAVVRAQTGSGGPYHISLLIRAITNTQTLVGGSREVTLPPGQTASVEVHVSPAAAGHVSIYIERFLPLDGWVFSRRVNLLTGSDGVARLSFRPPTIGRWRFRSFFRGTETASPSSSGYLVVTVRS